MKFDNNRIIFIHIPRTAGTYIENKLCEKYNCIVRWPEPNEQSLFGLYKINNNHYLTLQHLTLNEMIKYNYINKNIKNPFIFTIVRHPYNRIVSLYNKWFKNYKNLDIFLEELKNLNLNKYKHTGIETNNKTFNYKNMLSNLNEIKYFVIPQYYYIDNNDNYKVYIIKFHEVDSLNNILQLNLDVMSYSTNILTQSQKNKIYNIYKIDFDKFGFLQ